MARKRTARRSKYDAPNIALVKRYDKYTTYVGFIFAAMYIFLAFGAVMFGW